MISLSPSALFSKFLSLTVVGVGFFLSQTLADLDQRDFANSDVLQFNRAAQLVEKENGLKIFQLTSATKGQAGSVFSRQKLKSDRFSTYFQFRILEKGGATFDCNETNGADGIVFAVQTVASNVGSLGQGIGFSGIDRSIGVEFDTWCNRSNKDPDSNHLAFVYNGSVIHEDASDVISVEPDFDNGNIWHVWIDYDGTFLEVRIAEDAERPLLPGLSKELNLQDYLEGENAYVGFTSATGAAWGQHEILTWNYYEDYRPERYKQFSIKVTSTETATKEDPSAKPENVVPQTIVILDASASMRQTDVNGISRISVARDSLKALFEKAVAAGQPMGLRVFGHRGGENCRSQLLLPVLSHKASDVLSAINSIRSSSLGNTALAEAMRAVADDFSMPAGETLSGAKVIVLTDGEETCGGDLLAAIESLRAQSIDVVVDIVGFQMESNAIKTYYQNCAEVTGGQFFDSSSSNLLEASLFDSFASESEKVQTIHFEVLNAENEVVDQGIVDGEAVIVDPGRYRVRIGIDESTRFFDADATKSDVRIALDAVQSANE